jgi:PAS domain S-box-containing protein
MDRLGSSPLKTPRDQLPDTLWLRWTGASALLIAGIVAMGWLTGRATLTAFSPGGARMMPSSVVGTVLCGLCLFALAAGRRRLAWVFGTATVFGGLRAMIDLVHHRLFWLDAWAARIGWPVPPIDGTNQSPLNGALAFVLGGCALVVMASGAWVSWVVPLLGGAVAGLAVSPLLNYLVVLPLTDGSLAYRGMPLPAGLLMLVIAAAAVGGSARAMRSPESAARSMLAAAFGVLLAVGLVSLQTTRDLIARNQGVVHSHEVSERIEHFMTELASLEATARGYGLTGREDFHGRYREHHREVARALDALPLIAADNPDELPRVRRLRILTAARLVQNDALVLARDAQGAGAAAAILGSRSPAVAAELPDLVDELRRAERERLAQLEGELFAVQRSARVAQGFGSLLAVLLVGAAVAQTRRSATARLRAEESLRANQALLERRVADRTFELEQANAQLRESERSLRFLADAMPQMVWTHQPEGPVETVNREWREYTGLDEARSRGRGWEGVFHPEDVAPTLDLWAELMSEGREGGGELRLRRARDESFRWMLWRVRPERDTGGRIVRWVSTATDIHEQKAQREVLEQRVRERTAELAASQQSLALARDEALAASHLKSEFLANVSHEIRTPMNGIIGMSGILMDTDLSADQREMGRVIQQSSEALLAIINDILDFSKIEAGKLQIDPAEFDLRGVAADIVRLLTPRARQKAVELRVEFDAALDGGLVGDAGRLRQVLLNLVGNAVKFTDRGEVVVRIRRLDAADGRVSFRAEVSDTGVGIPFAAQAQLFQPFIQADGTITRRHGGTGLGLAISRQLIELMGGAIGCESEPGRGSRFWFVLSLPTRPPGRPPEPIPPDAVAVAETQRAAAGAGEVPPRDPSGLRLLIAEDNPVNQVVARRLLEKMGHSVDIAPDGLAALRQLAQGSYDAVLMDCQMPELDGYATTRRIRAGGVAGVDPRIPIIALTAYAMADDRAKCLEAGMDDYISKPVRPADLAAAFARCGLGVRTGGV